jgi:hypothetical protein
MVAICLLLLAIVGDGRDVAREHVDLLELNHFHDVNGRAVYSQVIFYDWAPDASAYHVRAWWISNNAGTNEPARDYVGGFYRVRCYDVNEKMNREITARHYRETWSQVDPERANKKLLDERQRRGLIKRTAAPIVAAEPVETE